jgi:hypothetical protein
MSVYTDGYDYAAHCIGNRLARIFGLDPTLSTSEMLDIIQRDNERKNDMTITEAQLQIEQILHQLEKDQGVIVDALSIDELEVTTIDDIGKRFRRYVRIQAADATLSPWSFQQ